MTANVSWAGGVSFAAQGATGHTVIMDGPAEKGGQNKGSRPMELLLMGLGGCTSFDVVGILQKSRQDVVDCQAQISAERADAVPSVFTKIHVHFVVSGRNLKPKVVERAIRLSAQEYCSASIMLVNAGVEVTHDFSIVEVD
ncbi:MAG: OsmC family protein [Gammaproteobacteria bacterium]|nr:OsmC family protein [Gammaproteobacteria bacterium]MCP4880245.1 OsmC family protein [Gammaproteobacteria bacterium]MDP6165685.1 OsmC family protein [Gammaproteobacteria bacterium]